MADTESRGIRTFDDPKGREDRAGAELALSVVVTVVNGKDLIRAHLRALTPQIDFASMEVIVPYDNWSADIGELADEFPAVEFFFFGDLGLTGAFAIKSNDHRLYDKRRALGLARCRGNIVAMTEDQGIPTHNWVQNVLSSHDQPYGVIGGAVENGVDRTINRAVYYSDFGRYGLPFESRMASYVSDVNVSYKRDALMAVKEIWIDGYRETSVHWAMLSRDEQIFLDNRPVVHQVRPLLRFRSALRERIAWGHVFAKTRVEAGFRVRNLLLAGGSLVLPALILARVAFHMGRQGLAPHVMVATLAASIPLAIAWSFGELRGYLLRRTDDRSVDVDRHE